MLSRTADSWVKLTAEGSRLLISALKVVKRVFSPEAPSGHGSLLQLRRTASASVQQAASANNLLQGMRKRVSSLLLMT